MAESSRLTFRVTPWRPWLLSLTPLALLAGLGVVVSVVAGERATAAGILLGFAGLAVALLLLIGVVVRAARWQVNRLKALKRQMYGRAKLDLLEKRFRYAA